MLRAKTMGPQHDGRKARATATATATAKLKTAIAGLFLQKAWAIANDDGGCAASNGLG